MINVFGGDFVKEGLEKVASELVDKLGTNENRTVDVEFGSCNERNDFVDTIFFTTFVIQRSDDLKKSNLPNKLKVLFIQTVCIERDEI